MIERTVGSLGIKVPVINPKIIPQVPMSPSTVTAWRALLPMADTGATAKKVYHALNECNQVEVNPTDRYEILELFRPPVQFICLELRKHYINQTKTLSKESLTISMLAQTLQLEMAEGYKLVIQHLVDSGKKKLQKKIIPTAIHRVIHYYTLILLRCYQLYSPAPPDIWKEIHILYKYAEDNDYLDEEIVDESISHSASIHTLTQTYEQALLLAATCPYQWRQNEQEHLNNALGTWAPYTKIRKANSNEKSKSGLFIIDLEKDLPPYPLSIGVIKPSKTTRILDVSTLIAHLKDLLNRFGSDELSSRIAQDGKPEFSVSTPIVRRLIQSWSCDRTRSYNRFPQPGSMRLSFGLSATHYYVSGEKHFNPESDDDLGTADALLPSCDISIEVEGEEEENTEMMSVLPGQEDLLDSSQTVDEDTDDDEEEGGNEYIIHECNLINISPAGFCLLWDEKSYPPIQSGEIIGLQSTMNIGDNPWSVGVVRWLKHTPDQDLVIGVQLLAPYATAAAAQLVKNNQSAGYYLRCLILPAMESMGLKSTLITPTLPFKKGSDLTLVYDSDQDSHDNRLEGSLTKLVDATDSYKQFDFIVEELEEEDEEDEHDEININVLPVGTLGSANAAQDDKDEFDSIWSSI